MPRSLNISSPPRLPDQGRGAGGSRGPAGQQPTRHVRVPARQPLGEFLTQDWLPAIRATVEPSTHESYTRYLTRHVIPRIGGIPLQQLDAGILNKLYADLLDHGRLDGRPGGLSARTVRYIHTIIGRALREAVAWDRVARNVARAAQPPSTAQAQPPEMRTLGRRDGRPVP